MEDLGKTFGRGTDGALVGVIGDEDTITGFLLADVGEKSDDGKQNFFAVDSS
jgi:vacuolar-type H+-ATPase subunit F/Vma7